MAYLKYYIGLDKNYKLFLDSIPCLENEPIIEPSGFLKWYEEGDFIEPDKELTNTDSPVFWAIFSPKEASAKVKNMADARIKELKHVDG